MGLYRIKKEAYPYIDDYHTGKIRHIEEWKRLGVSEKALQNIEDILIIRKESDITEKNVFKLKFGKYYLQIIKKE